MNRLFIFFCLIAHAPYLFTTSNSFSDKVYINAPGHVYEIDSVTDTVSRDFTIAGSAGVMTFRGSNLLYRTSSSSTNLGIINLTTGDVTLQNIGVIVWGITIPPGSNLAFLPTVAGTNLYVLDLSTNTIVQTITGNSWYFGVSSTPDGAFVYAADIGDDAVKVISTTAPYPIVATIPVGNNPTGLLVTRDGTKVYVTNNADNSLSVISTASNTVIDTIPLAGTAPFSVGDSPDGVYVYAASAVSKMINIIAISSNTVVANIATGSSQNTDFVEASTNDKIYVSSANANTVFVFQEQSPYSPITTISITRPGFILSSNDPLTIFNNSSGRNVFLNNYEIYNQISWTQPIGMIPVNYFIYRDASFSSLAGVVPASTGSLSFIDHTRRAGQTYDYYLVVENSYGIRIFLGSTTITSAH